MEGTITVTTETGAISDPQNEAGVKITPPDGTTTAARLTEEIANLWSDHVRLHSTHKATAIELRLVRSNLAERLHAMKSLLSHPGRSGQWRSWLMERGIPRSTADRLAARHAETLGTSANVPSGAIAEPTMDGVGAKLAKTVWQDFMKVLTTDESIVEFIASISKLSGVAHEWRPKGLMIFRPVPRAADDFLGSTCAPKPASAPSDNAGPNVEELSAETAMAIPAIEQAAGAVSSCEAL
jgi:hypothetical protein